MKNPKKSKAVGPEANDKEVWDEDVMAEKWTGDLIVPMLKKGNPIACSNYRGFRLLNTAYKILTALSSEKIKTYF